MFKRLPDISSPLTLITTHITRMLLKCGMINLIVFIQSCLLEECHIARDTTKTSLYIAFRLQLLALAHMSSKVFSVHSTSCALLGLRRNTYINSNKVQKSEYNNRNNILEHQLPRNFFFCSKVLSCQPSLLRNSNINPFLNFIIQKPIIIGWTDNNI